MMKWKISFLSLVGALLLSCAHQQASEAMSCGTSDVQRRDQARACVADIRADARERILAALPDSEVTESRLALERFGDINRDGIQEILVIDPFSGTANSVHILYRGEEDDCLLFAGFFFAEPESLSVLSNREEGFADLELRQKNASCEGGELWSGSVLHFRFESNEYREMERIECRCPDASHPEETPYARSERCP